MSSPKVYPQFRTDVQYSEESSLNTLDVCLPRPITHDSSQIWIVFLHGGAWRDPSISASSFRATQTICLSSKSSASIAGYASINYRLSPYPSHPSDPSNPSDPARNAKHPDHINDVLDAILYLQETYMFEERYILIGHSVGATLAFQVAMKRYWGSQYESTYALELNVVPPTAIVGVEGIYDIHALVRAHAKQSIYRDFVANALGDNESVWTAVSPTAGNYDESWPDGKLVVLIHSWEDELVEREQAVLQMNALRSQGWAEASKTKRVDLIEIRGKHDEVWQSPRQMARAIEMAVNTVVGMLGK